MMVESGLMVPDDVTFEQAIACTQTLLDQIAQGQMADSGIEQVVCRLVASENGARGFFVVYLSGEHTLNEQATALVLQAIRTASQIIAPLLVKNLVMSTAMAITHRRNQDESLAQGSDRVRSRTTHLIQTLQLPQIHAEAKKLATSIQTHTGDYQPFLDRWHYDVEQQQAMYQTLEQIGILG